MHEHYAFPMHPGIEAVMRFSSVKRWHMLDTVRVQTLAEHSANVALLAMLLANTAPSMYFGHGAGVAAWGLVHDLPEVFTGDVPTPTKKHIAGLEELEARLVPALMPEPIEAIRQLVKVCDLADGWRFIRMHGSGAIAHHARQGIENQFYTRARALIEVWPPEVYEHVFEGALFYALEAGIPAPQRPEIPNVGQMDLNLARGSGDSAGGPRHFVRDDWTGP